jgi:hypothetical protein
MRACQGTTSILAIGVVAGIIRMGPGLSPSEPPNPSLGRFRIMNKSLVLATLVAAFALAACGKKEAAPAPAPAAAPAPAPAPAPAAAPASAASAAAPAAPAASK